MKKYLVILGFLLFTQQIFAADECSVELTGNDQMKYNLTEINVPKSCEEYTINLSHIGKMPRQSMGHNVVISKTADKMSVATDGIAAGLDNEYVKVGDDRVIAFSKVIGGGEKTSVTFKTADLQAGGDYSFFCSFPGHVALMSGKVVIK